ncbi:MAG: SCO family protein [Pirellulaceae bacterium]|nr:SCO family protein [Pirellulaceae bacterium]
MSRGLIGWLAIFLLFCGAMIVWFVAQRKPIDGHSGTLHSTIDDDYPGKDEDWIDDFTLTERSGQEFESESMAGNVWVTSVFFSVCRASCYQQNELVMRLHKEFGDRGVKFMSLTCDPIRDTPAVLSAYARQFNADDTEWVFLTGHEIYLRRVAGERFQLASANDATQGPTHSDRFAVVDKWGKIRGHFLWQDPENVVKMKLLIEQLIAETDPPQETTKQTLPQDHLKYDDESEEAFNDTFDEEDPALTTTDPEGPENHTEQSVTADSRADTGDEK